VIRIIGGSRTIHSGDLRTILEWKRETPPPPDPNSRIPTKIKTNFTQLLILAPMFSHPRSNLRQILLIPSQDNNSQIIPTEINSLNSIRNPTISFNKILQPSVLRLNRIPVRLALHLPPTHPRINSRFPWTRDVSCRTKPTVMELKTSHNSHKVRVHQALATSPLVHHLLTSLNQTNQ
jgi:hypothetical protein